MIDHIEDFFWENFIKNLLSFGNNWIVFISIPIIVIYFRFIKKYMEMNTRDTFKSKAFLIPSVTVLLLCFASYFTILMLPLPKDRFVIVITNFIAVPDDKATEKAAILKDRLIENIRERKKQYGVKVSIKPLKEIIDCSSEEGKQLARELGSQERAHVVICGKVRLDEEYYFEPIIINLIESLGMFKVKREIDPIQVMNTVSELEQLKFKKQKIDEITDFVTFIFGLAKYESKEYLPAINIFASIKEQTAESLFYSGNSFYAINRSNKALTAYERALQINLDSAATWNNKGTALRNLGKNEEALTAYERALQINSNYAFAWSNKGVALSHLGRYEGALTAYERALQIIPRYVTAWYNKGNALRKVGRNEEALTAYERALQINPNFAAAWNNKGNALNDLGIYAKALTAYERALQINPNYVDAWSNKGGALSQLGKNEEALTALERALQINLNYAAAWNNKGSVLYHLGRDEEALTAYKRALQINPSYALASYNLACKYALKGKKGHALKNLAQAIKFDRRFKDKARTDKAFNNLHNDNDFKYLID